MTTQTKRLPAGRKADLVAFVAESGQVTVAQLASEFKVSVDTIRRDLDTLHSIGAVVRTHGGAVSPKGQAKPDTQVDDRVAVHFDAKQKIGAAAAALVNDHDAVMLGSGTTVLAALPNLAQSKGLIVVTNSLLIPDRLPPGVTRDVYLLGGAVRIDGQATVGPVVLPGSINSEHQINCDLAIIGVGGVSATEGITTSHVGEAQMMSEMMRVSRRVAILADSSKFNAVLFSQICMLDEVDYLVTDREPPVDLKETLKNAGVELIVA